MNIVFKNARHDSDIYERKLPIVIKTNRDYHSLDIENVLLGLF